MASKIRRVYHADSALAAEFDRIHPGVAASLREGMRVAVRRGS
ncbi:MAG: hypothetical protein ACRDSZ_18775 [Pseudonocardiaceae bacterium]